MKKIKSFFNQNILIFKLSYKVNEFFDESIDDVDDDILLNYEVKVPFLPVIKSKEIAENTDSHIILDNRLTVGGLMINTFIAMFMLVVAYIISGVSLSNLDTLKGYSLFALCLFLLLLKDVVVNIFENMQKLKKSADM